MKRRKLTQMMIATGAAALLPGADRAAANENKSNDDRESPARFGRIELNTGLQVIIPVRLLIIRDNFTKSIGVDLKREFPIQNENRNGFLNPTLGQRYRHSVEIGVVRLSGRTLVMSYLPKPTVKNVFLMNGSTSYRINAGRLGRDVTPTVPTLGNLPILGRVFRHGGNSSKRDNLLILVTPTIIDDDF